MPINVGMGADLRCCDVAASLCQLGGLRGCWLVWRLDEIVCVDFRGREKPADDVGIVVAVIGHFGDWAFTDVIVTGEGRISGEMRRRGPKSVIPMGVAVCLSKPDF